MYINFIFKKITNNSFVLPLLRGAALLLVVGTFCAAFFLPCTVAVALGSKPSSYSPGYHSFSVPGSDNASEADTGSLAFGVWFPSDRPVRNTYSHKTGGWVIRATVRADRKPIPAEGRFPVILLSHDMARQQLASHDLCSALAEAGFVVIASTHAGDNYKNSSALFSAAMLYHRPLHLRKALDLVAADEHLGPALNLDRVGLLGVGLGTVTVMQLAGVDINESFYAGYCAQEERDAVFCSRWAAARLAELEGEAKAIRQKFGAGAFRQAIPQVRAVGLLTPGGMDFLRRDGVANLGVQVAAFFAGQDELYAPPLTPEAFTRMFPSPLLPSVHSFVAEGADHYSLGAGCLDIHDDENSPCGNMSESAKEKAHSQRDDFFISFFLSALGGPALGE